MPPLKKGGYCFATVGLSVSRSLCMLVCRPTVVRSISFDPFTRSIPNLVQGLMIPIYFQVTFLKVKVKPISRAQCVVCSISFDSSLDQYQTWCRGALNE